MINPDALAGVKLRKAGPTRVSRADGCVYLEDSHDGTGIARRVEGQQAPLIEAAPDPLLACIIPGRLFLGSQDAMFNEGGVKDAGIVLVIHLAYCYRPENLPPDVRFLRAPVLDTDQEALMPSLKKHNILNEIADAEGAVLVTCNAGVSRSASAVIAYLILREGMSYEKAHGITYAARPQIRVSNFEKELRSLAPCKPTMQKNEDTL
eukprot:CAMPEP_0197436110 /NCGR_PEP_ID=MMETSP1175-20131217/3590_1 /TAXON_ID=1003142 /ORGANISM="Triceratium dubium, Strain CCMP147" /LENGTH=206 /DNA_ID=CAMNT_0042965317 /DNA_START=14 /DNA_END=634 /DNA_ORIENTATION=+